MSVVEAGGGAGWLRTKEATMSTTTHPVPRVDRAHHHPRVERGRTGAWRWVCDCGGASDRGPVATMTWHQAVVGALLHSTSIAP